MIDIENALFTEIKRALVSAYPSISVEGVEDYVPSSFPFVNFYESDNSTNRRTIDSSGTEKYAKVTYVANVYSAKKEGKKAEAKAILGVIDNIMTGYGFVRQSTRPVDTNDPTLHRRTARYRANVSTDKVIFRG